MNVSNTYTNLYLKIDEDLKKEVLNNHTLKGVKNLMSICSVQDKSRNNVKQIQVQFLVPSMGPVRLVKKIIDTECLNFGYGVDYISISGNIFDKDW